MLSSLINFIHVILSAWKFILNTLTTSVANICISLRLGFPSSGKFSWVAFHLQNTQGTLLCWKWAYLLPDSNALVVGYNRAQALESSGLTLNSGSMSDLRSELGHVNWSLWALVMFINTWDNQSYLISFLREFDEIRKALSIVSRRKVGTQQMLIPFFLSYTAL